MKIAIAGAGGGGLSTVVDLQQRSINTHLWHRSEPLLDKIRQDSGIRYEGKLGDGKESPEMLSSDLAKVIEGTDALLICLPTSAHSTIANLLIDINAPLRPVILSPGNTGGALEFQTVFVRRNQQPPPIAELSTLPYVVRKQASNSVSVTGVAKHLWLAALPGGDEASDIAEQLYPCAQSAPDVLATGLASVNMVLHTPGSVLGSAWVEATQGDFTFYVEGLTDGVARVISALDTERLAVASAVGHSLPDLFNEMRSIGTIEPDADSTKGIVTAIRSARANRNIKAPDALTHRYYQEDFWYGLLPFITIARIVQVAVPVAESLMTLAMEITGNRRLDSGRTGQAMGIADLDKQQLLKKVCRK